MKFGLIGDVHSEDQHLETALAALTERGVDRILCVGDVADGHGSVDGCVALLVAHDVLSVRGNHDDWLLRGAMRNAPDATLRDAVDDASIDFLERLPSTLEVDTPEGTLMLCHGLGPNNMARLNEDDFDFDYTRDNHVELQDILAARRYAFVVSGHSHKTWLRTFDGVTFVKAGTLKREHSPGYAVLDTAARRLEWIPLA